MTNFYYYSSWNKHNRKGPVKKFFSLVLSLPKWIINKLGSDRKLRRKVFKFSFYAAFAFFIFLGITFIVVSLSLPDPNKLNARIIPQSTKIYARDGETLLYEVHGEARRTLVELEAIPDYVKEATIAIEEKNFYQNRGIDFRGILRAIFKNITSGDLTGEGGSTITQQFVRNAILTREKTFTRKIKEAILAIQIEQRFTKDEILKLYLNEIPYGQNAYGIEAAAQTYFSKRAQDLSLAEAAYLAALPQAPTFYSPNGPNRDRLDARQKFVLSQMQEQGYITSTQMEQALSDKVEFNKIKNIILAPHFVLYVQGLLAEKYGEKTLEEGGLEVVTTLDYNLQQLAEKAVEAGVARNRANNRAENAALTAIDPKTGQILAMVGSRDFFDEEYDGQVNIALRERQPGSSIKPYVYAAGFKQGMNPATMLIDVQTVFGTVNGENYAPLNYDGKDHGILSARTALAGSLNVPAVKMLALTGVQNAINTMKDLGITADLNTDRCGLSLVLGGCEISLLDHTSAMGVLASGGIRHEDTPILKVTDADGKILEEFDEQDRGREVIDPQVAYEIVSIMTDNEARAFTFGSNSPLILPGRTVAAKTGTTQAWREGWTVGFTPSLVAGVWVGNNDFSSMRPGADGVIVAAPIWNQFMREALANTPAEIFPEPAGIQHVLVDAVSGKLPTEYTPQTKTEVFADFAVPDEFDDVHVPIKVNTLNGKKASDLTPPQLVETRVYMVIHSEMPANPNWENPVRVWAANSGYNLPPTEEDDGSGSGINNPKISFLTPAFNQEINSLPLEIQVAVTGSGVNSVELILEGKSKGTKTAAPYNFSIGSADNGWQTLTAVARLSNGESIETNTRIYININP